MTQGGSSYFLSQRIGRWRWPWFVLGVVAGLAVMAVALLSLSALVAVADELGSDWAGEASAIFESDDLDAVSTVPSLVGFELVLVGVSFWAAAIGGTLVQGRSVRSLVEPVRSFDWSITRKVLTLQAVLLTATVAPAFLLPWLDRPEFSGVGRDHLVWLVPMSVLILVQTSGEDVFFKGYLLRQIGAVTKVAWLAPPIVVTVFVALHVGNPDVQTSLWLILPVFAISELMAVYLTMRTAGMEVAIAWHWFNNAAIFLLVAERATQSNDLTLFVFDDDPGTITDDAITAGLYAVFLALQLLAFTTRHSPFFLEPHRWGQVADRTSSWDTSAAPPTRPPMLRPEGQ